jgi:polyhydroxyalkanoate synthesis regulator phasin
LSERPEKSEERGVAEALRSAVERTLELAGRPAGGGAALTRDRATELLDELARRGREARDALARRGQEAGAELSRRRREAGGELARRGEDARHQVARRLERLERRLAALEEALRPEGEGERKPRPEAED